MMLALIGEPLQVGVSYELGGRHGQHVHETHILYFLRNYFQNKNQMDNWIPWLASWYPAGTNPLNRRQREILLNILYKNPLELRVALLTHQIRKMFSNRL
jgi:hypothetical protein